MRILTVLVALAALGCAVAIAIAGPGTQMGWWSWQESLGMVWKAATPLELGPVAVLPAFLLAGVTALMGLIAFFIGGRGVGVFALSCAAAVGGLGVVPMKMKQRAEANPFIHDITTDFEDPPAIVAGASDPRDNPAAYVGAEKVFNSEMTVAEAQRAAFPDITSRRVNAGLDETAEIVRVILPDMNMEMLNETLDDDGYHFEATYTSTWFGFVDDFVVRLTPAGSMTRVDVRSKSRVGLSDLGANAERVRAFYAKLDAATN